MEYKVFDNTIVVRLDKNDELAKSLLEVAKREEVFAASITGIGAVDEIEVGVFDLETNEYRHLQFVGNHEINALVGNLTTKDGKPYLHLHITCTDTDGKVVGGHLFDARVSLTAEIFINFIDAKLERKFDTQLNINRISF